MPRALASLISNLKKLPGIGEKSAQRIARYILKLSAEEANSLSTSIVEALALTKRCSRCGNLTEDTLCRICSSSSRIQNEICVVEEAFDIEVIEKAAVYHGLYHVLGGVLSPLEDISPEQLNISSLMKRVEEEKTREVILATSATTEGEATANYIADKLKDMNIIISRIARGIPVGSDLGLADEVTIGNALKDRGNVNQKAQD